MALINVQVQVLAWSVMQVMVDALALGLIGGVLKGWLTLIAYYLSQQLFDFIGLITKLLLLHGELVKIISWNDWISVLILLWRSSILNILWHLKKILAYLGLLKLISK